MKKRIGFGLLLLSVWAAPAWAAVEFSGNNVPGVTATGHVEGWFNSGRTVTITVKNGSSKNIPAPYDLTDYFLVLKDGRRIELGKPKMALFPSGNAIRPKATVTLKAHLGDLQVSEDDIEMIICSFNLGETKIVLTRAPAPDKPAKTK